VSPTVSASLRIEIVPFLYGPVIGGVSHGVVNRMVEPKGNASEVPMSLLSARVHSTTTARLNASAS
jgi:hypothetical protein